MLERRLMLFCINQIDHDLTSSGQNLIFKIPVSETNSNYNEIREACDTIQSKRIKLIDNGEEFDSIVPFPRVRYYQDKDNKKSYIELTMFADSVKYFIELKNQYTSYSLEAMLKIKSLFSQRIYEIMQMQLGQKKWTFVYDVDYLRNILDCKYPDFYDFKRRVLNPAIKDIRSATGFELSYVPHKKIQKKVVEIKFTVKTPVTAGLAKVAEERDDMKHRHMYEIFEEAHIRLNSYDLSKKQMNQIMNDYELMNIFFEIDSQIRNGVRKPGNPTAYLAACLGFDKKKEAKTA